jgi:Ca-activated chloride channel homolog
MKRFAFVWLNVFSLTLFISAQSGRKIQTDDTPSQNISKPETIINTNDTGKTEGIILDYSESASNKPRRIYTTPTITNNKDKSDKKKQNSNELQTINIDDGEIVKVDTNLINIPVSVFDRYGLYIPNLQKSDFKIFEDEKEQEIAYFGTSEKPFTVVLLIDVSPSTAYKIEEIQQAATAFVDQLKIQDSVMVIEFDEKVHVLADLTNNRDKIYKAIRKADFGGGTSLYEAVDSSLRKRLDKIQGRKAIVLFTDGVDTTSKKADYDSTLQQAEESEAMIFPIYYNTFGDNYQQLRMVMNPRGTRPEDYELGRKYLDDLSAITGGRVFRPDATPGGLTAAFEGIAEELRRQYNIGYIPQEEGQTGQRKQIKVRVNRPKLVVRARDSYIVGASFQTNH